MSKAAPASTSAPTRRAIREAQAAARRRKTILGAAGAGLAAVLAGAGILVQLPAAGGQLVPGANAAAGAQRFVLPTGAAHVASLTDTAGTDIDRSPATLKPLAFEMAKQRYGWGADQARCLDDLWTRESNWRWDATNPDSGAYGVAQAWPAEKYNSTGADWKTNPVTQISWGLDYIKRAHGTPCAVMSKYVNWY